MMTSFALLRLLQIADSGFPTGGYALSHGLEGLHATGVLATASDVERFVTVHIEETLAQLELPVVAHAWRRAAAGDVGGLLDLDLLVNAFKPVPSFRRGSLGVGRRLLEATSPHVDDGSVCSELLLKARDDSTVGHHAMVWGVVCHEFEIDETESVLAYGAVSLSGYVAAAVRLGVIGQRAAQTIVWASHDLLMRCAGAAGEIDLDDLGGYTPMIDISGLRQDQLASRLFAS